MYPCIVLSLILLSNPNVNALVLISLEDEFAVPSTFPTLILPSLQYNQSSLYLFEDLLNLTASGTNVINFLSFGFKKFNSIFCLLKFLSVS